MSIPLRLPTVGFRGSKRNRSAVRNGGEAALDQRRKALVERGEAAEYSVAFAEGRSKRTKLASTNTVIKS
ncbi:MAG: hypothetical protein LUC92_04260 [Clostridiales bacterium]|nr:hypothetical protein [Clostridiales bacterium]